MTDPVPIEAAAVDIRQGCVLSVLPTLDAESVHCCVTSPPYFGLRSYPIPDSEWPAVSYAPIAGMPKIEIPGCDPECAHEWGDNGRSNQRQRNGATGGLHEGRATNKLAGNVTLHPSTGAFCQKCGGWRGQLGGEPTIDMYVGHLVHVFRLVWRVLRCDGTCWINLGDSYARNGGTPGGGNRELLHMEGKQRRMTKIPKGSGLKAKDLMLIPSRVALALQADGWWLRSEIIWHKPNPMPESVTDRPTRAHEQVYLLAKSPKYFYDHEAIKEKAVSDHASGNGYARPEQITKGGRGQSEPWIDIGGKRNRRSVWKVGTRPSSLRHYAGWPPDLVAPMIKAGTSQKGVCADCGSPWQRVVEMESIAQQGGVASLIRPKHREMSGTLARQGGFETSGLGAKGVSSRAKTTGWRPTCSCNAGEPIPATVLDPFMGTGVTLETARKLGRYAIGIDAAPDYTKMAHHRTAQQHLF